MNHASCGPISAIVTQLFKNIYPEDINNFKKTYVRSSDAQSGPPNSRYFSTPNFSVDRLPVLI